VVGLGFSWCDWCDGCGAVVVCGVGEQVDFPLLHDNWLPVCEKVDFALYHAASFDVHNGVFSGAVVFICGCDCLGGGIFVFAVECPNLFPSCLLGDGLMFPWDS
jgi:hypothetical protein